MFRKKVLLLVLSVSIILSAGLIISWKSESESGIDRPSGNDIAIRWELVSNNHAGQSMFKSLVTLTNNSNKVLENKNWELYFNNSACRKIVTDSVPNTIKIEHLNGDFYRITPTEAFPQLAPKQSYTFHYISGDFVIKNSDAPGGFYFVFIENGEPTTPEAVKNYSVGAFDSKEKTSRSNFDNLEIPTPNSLFEENKFLTLLPKKDLPLVIPTPLKTTITGDSIYLSPSTEIRYQKGLEQEAQYLAEALKDIYQKPFKVVESTSAGKDAIFLTKKKLAFSTSKQAYEVKVSKNDGFILAGNDNEGVFYAVQTLRALIPVEVYGKAPQKAAIKTVSIEDAPQLEFRGMLLDVVRHFHSKEKVLNLIEALSFYKINKLHLHLADDEGWRIEIEELPELTIVGSRRGHTLDDSDRLLPAYGSGPFGELTSANGYYSRKDFIEILQFAKARHIEIIPKIDLPGHARAAIKSMDARYRNFMAKGDSVNAKKYLLRDLNDKSEYRSVQQYNDNVICPCQESSYTFIQTVVEDIKEIYTEANVPFQTIHLGGDEVPTGVWEKSPACKEFMSNNKNINSINDIKNYFLERTLNIIGKENLVGGYYEDAVLEHVHGSNTPPKVIPEFKKYPMKIYVWNNVWGWGNEDACYKLANEGYPVILSNVTNLYFDLAYDKHPEEPGFYWGGFNNTRKAFEFTPYNIYNCAYKDGNGNAITKEYLQSKVRLTEKGKQNIKGMIGLLFSETLKTPDMLEYYTFPKVIGLAERAWAKQPDWASIENQEQRLEKLNKDWNVFANALGQRELPRLDYISKGIGYRLPPVGAVIENGLLKANTTFPGLTIRYTTDGSIPTATSTIYTEPVKVNGVVNLATFNSKGRSSKVNVVKTIDNQ
ncbi:MAG TPA: family 20 glycosylhydrolase [Cytophagaceae bacterium]